MRSYAASPWTTTKVVRLPGALPFFFTGLRIASSRAVIAAIVAEYFGGLQNGLGPGITSAAAASAYPRAWAFVTAAIGLGLVFYLAAVLAERLGDALATTTRRTLVSRFLHRRRLGGRAGRRACWRWRPAEASDNCVVEHARPAPPAARKQLTKVKLQLQWFTQAQFAGYFAALHQGYYKDAGLDVQILEGGTDIVPQTLLAQGRADYAIAWVPKALQSREQGAGITDVGQVFQRSGTLQVSFKDKNITTAADLKGKKVGNWGFGNEFELFAGMTKAGLNPGKDVDARPAAVRHAGAAQGRHRRRPGDDLQRVRPGARGQEPQDRQALHARRLQRIDWNNEGTAMLQDAIWANTDKLKTTRPTRTTTVKFLKASFKGWVYCRDNAEKCRDIVVARGSKLGASHQLWQMNEINKLIWPSPHGIGMVDKAAWDQTVKVASSTKNADGDTVLTKAPEGLAYTNDYAQKALDALKAGGVDVTGTDFKPITVKLTPAARRAVGPSHPRSAATSYISTEVRWPVAAGSWRSASRRRRSAALSRGGCALPTSPRGFHGVRLSVVTQTAHRVRARSGRAMELMESISLCPARAGGPMRFVALMSGCRRACRRSRAVRALPRWR